MGLRTGSIRVKDLAPLHKDLWGTLEVLIKTVKALPGKQSGISIKKAMWSDIEKSISALKSMEDHLIVGNYYKWSTSDREKSYLIFRVESFEYRDSDDSKPLRMVCRPLTCTKSKEERFEYQDLKEEMVFSLGEIYGDISSVDLEKKDLPLYIGNKYNGTLLRELLSEDEATAGLAQELADKESKQEDDDE